MIRVCLAGLGRTGKEIARILLEQPDMKLVSVICSPGSTKEGMDLGDILEIPKTGIRVESSEHLQYAIFRSKPDVVIDFSNAESTIRNAKLLSKMRVNIVVGTTGFSKTGLQKLKVLSRKYHNGIVYAPNITLGVNVLMFLTNLAANILNEYDFEVLEIHHKQKKDAPSGTAVKIAGEIARGLNSAGIEKTGQEIPISAIRAGGVVGKHEVMIIGENDKIEICHESFSRKAFALGALKAVRFVQGKSGYFEMNDVLNLRKVLFDYLQKDGKNFESKGYSESVSG